MAKSDIQACMVLAVETLFTVLVAVTPVLNVILSVCDVLTLSALFQDATYQ
jgi:hypothetical protein